MSEIVEQVLEDSLRILSRPGDLDYSQVEQVRELWHATLVDDPAFIEKLYGFYLRSIRTLLGETNEDATPERLADDATLYGYVIAFADSGYLDRTRAREKAWALLAGAQSPHLGLLDEALVRANDPLVESALRTRTGRWGDIVCAMLELYAWHRPYGRGDDVLREEIARRIPVFFRRFPDQDSSILLRELMHHPYAVGEVAGLIRFHLIDRDRPDAEALVSPAHPMLGFNAQKGSSLHDKSPAILAMAVSDAVTWPADRVAAFVGRVRAVPTPARPRLPGGRRGERAKGSRILPRTPRRSAQAVEISFGRCEPESGAEVAA